jgi:hypothetical protein
MLFSIKKTDVFAGKLQERPLRFGVRNGLSAANAGKITPASAVTLPKPVRFAKPCNARRAA